MRLINLWDWEAHIPVDKSRAWEKWVDSIPAEVRMSRHFEEIYTKHERARYEMNQETIDSIVSQVHKAHGPGVLSS
jgi:hypothetical protein